MAHNDKRMGAKVKEFKMKRKIVLMQYVHQINGYEEVKTLAVAKHKGLPEIIKMAQRECAKMNKPAGETAYLIFDKDGECIWREQYGS